MPAGEVVVRFADAGDDDAIADTLTRAFAREHEAMLVGRLRQSGAAIISLVADVAGAVVGHAMLSRVDARIDGRTIEVLALAPVGVRPTHQQRGIGSLLTSAAIDCAADAGAEAVLVVGDPGFYGRFGFSSGRARVFVSRYSGDAFQALEIVPGALSGESGMVDYPQAFSDA